MAELLLLEEEEKALGSRRAACITSAIVPNLFFFFVLFEDDEERGGDLALLLLLGVCFGGCFEVEDSAWQVVDATAATTTMTTQTQAMVNVHGLDDDCQRFLCLWPMFGSFIACTYLMDTLSLYVVADN